MEIKIRLNTFETNSSSAHTCVLKRGAKPVDTQDIEDFKVALFEEIRGSKCFVSEDNFFLPIDNSVCYSRGLELLDEWRDRLSYIIADASDIEILKEITEVVKRKIPGCQGLLFYLYEDYINKFTDTSSICTVNPFDEYEILESMTGNVDHQSRGNSQRCLEAMSKLEKYKGMTRSELIEEFIFSNNIVVIVDGDETADFFNLVKGGLLDESVKLILTERSSREHVNGKTSYTYYGIFVEPDAWISGESYEDY